MLIALIVVFLLVSLLVVAAVAEEFDGWILPVVFVGTFLLCFCVMFVTSYQWSVIDVAELSARYETNLNNLQLLASKANDKLVVKTDNDKLIVDVANLSQSTKTTELYVGYVNEVNKFNTELAKAKAVRKSMWTMLFVECALSLEPIPDNLKLISIQM